MRVCVVGAGGREHALADALSRTADVVVTPANPGMAALAGGRFAVTGADPAALDADLWVIGPEAPLVDGLADRLRAGGRAVLGPGADGARLEGSKAHMKGILSRAGVPTAAYACFEDVGPALEHLRSLPGPWVVKTDGLAAGKGVLVTDDLDRAEADVRAKLDGSAFGAAGRRVVIEEHLEGVELSVMALCDGTRAVALGAARDHKRLGDGDTGPNTGGMGAYSPVPGAGPEVVDAVVSQAVEPTLAALAEAGVDYRGVLYAGVMLTADGPRLLEFNVRLGDPEAEAVLPRWEGDVAAVLAAAAAGRLDEAPAPEWSPDAAVTVVLAAAGYPGAPRAGDPIDGLDRLPEGARVYAAGVGEAGGRLVTAGGRVLAVTGLGPDLPSARAAAYDTAGRITFAGLQLRHDIAATTPPPPGSGRLPPTSARSSGPKSSEGASAASTSARRATAAGEPVAPLPSTSARPSGPNSSEGASAASASTSARHATAAGEPVAPLPSTTARSSGPNSSEGASAASAPTSARHDTAAGEPAAPSGESTPPS